MASQNPEDRNDRPGNPKMENRSARDERRERRHRDPLRGLFVGLLLILLGVLLYAQNQHWVGADVWWKYFMIGLGAIFIIDSLVHYAVPSARYFIFGRFIAGVVLISIGFLFLYGSVQWWPLILIAVGIAFLINSFFRRRQ
jgi:hypothetical protein